MAPKSATASEMRWRSHPLLSTLVKAVVIVAPAVAAAAVAVAISRALSIPHGAPGTVMWWGVLLVTTFATWLVFATLLQRLLPLAALLDLTLLFPDAAPSRFAMLRRSANPRQLQSELRRLRDAAPDAEPGHRAQVILELAAALSIHDSRTRGHSERVRMFTDLVAQQLRLRKSDADRLRWAALLHDIGKLSVAAEILNKPGRPDHEEWETLHRHPLEGYRLIAPLHEWLGDWAATVRDHHERFDGSGYPNGLKAQAISLGGRIVAVTDSYETMTAARPYKAPMSVRAAREELVRMSESHFDPAVVKAFLEISLGRLWQAIGLTALVAQLPLLAPASRRLSQVGSRSVSALTAAAATATLVAAGFVGPPSPAYVYGASSAENPSVQATTSSTQPSSAPAAPKSPAEPGTPPTTTRQVASSPGPGTGTAAGQSSSAAAKAPSYPAGISRRVAIPKGIAKKPSAFNMWRIHH